MIDDIYLQNIIQQAVEESEFREYAEREFKARAEVELKSIDASERSFVELPIFYNAKASKAEDIIPIYLRPFYKN